MTWLVLLEKVTAHVKVLQTVCHFSLLACMPSLCWMDYPGLVSKLGCPDGPPASARDDERGAPIWLSRHCSPPRPFCWIACFSWRVWCIACHWELEEGRGVCGDPLSWPIYSTTAQLNLIGVSAWPGQSVCSELGLCSAAVMIMLWNCHLLSIAHHQSLCSPFVWMCVCVCLLLTCLQPTYPPPTHTHTPLSSLCPLPIAMPRTGALPRTSTCAPVSTCLMGAAVELDHASPRTKRQRWWSKAAWNPRTCKEKQRRQNRTDTQVRETRGITEWAKNAKGQCPSPVVFLPNPI